MKSIKIVPQTYTTPSGIKKSYGVILNGIPFREYSENELKIFLKAVGAKYVN